MKRKHSKVKYFLKCYTKPKSNQLYFVTYVMFVYKNRSTRNAN